jgi:hypothetical protein
MSTAPQLVSGREMARRVCCSPATLTSATEAGRVRPDFVAEPGGRILFFPTRDIEIAATLDGFNQASADAA